MRALHIVILAAGRGKRMRSDRPKVLHSLAGRPLLAYAIDAASRLDPDCIHVVYGYGGAAVREAMVAAEVNWVEQRELLGTGHAVAQAMCDIPDDAAVLVLYGDVPLIDHTMLYEITTLVDDHTIALVTAMMDDPGGYGRIIRDSDGQVRSIVEEKDTTEEQRNLTEINTGILATGAGRLRGWLDGLGCDNTQCEYYLTDVITLAVEDGLSIRTISPAVIEEVLGVNDHVQLAALERFYQQHLAETLMRAGAHLADPARIDIRGHVHTGSDVFIDANVVFEGEVTLGDRVRIGLGCVIKDAVIENDTEIHAYSIVEKAHIGAACRVGPFARLRPDARLLDEAHVGSFVEIKSSVLGEGSQANHLAYIGDSRIGRNVNVGAGVVTCNYDGANKHATVIEDDVFIGSGTMLVAPVTVHAGATIGAGSVIRKDAPANALTLTRTPQKTLEDWRRPRRR